MEEEAAMTNDTGRLLARIARLEAQSDIRGRAVVMYRDRAREAEAREEQLLLRNRNLLDAHRQAEAIIRRQERYIEGLESVDAVGLEARAQRAEARIKAVQDALSFADMGETLVTRSRIRRALDGDA